ARPDVFGRRNSAARASEPRPDPGDDGLGPVELDDADLDTDADLDNADPGDFGDLDPDDTDLQATLTVMAVLADDISDGAELADDLPDDRVGDADGLEAPDQPEDLEDLADLEAGQPLVAGESQAGLSPEASEDEEVLVLSDDDDDLPTAKVAITGATADPVK